MGFCSELEWGSVVNGGCVEMNGGCVEMNGGCVEMGFCSDSFRVGIRVGIRVRTMEGNGANGGRKKAWKIEHGRLW